MKFKFRDKVWLMKDNKPIEVSICKVVNTQSDDDRGTPSTTTDLYIRTEYYTTPIFVQPTEIFRTKKELLDSL